jgi:hypothetical protein
MVSNFYPALTPHPKPLQTSLGEGKGGASAVRDFKVEQPARNKRASRLGSSSFGADFQVAGCPGAPPPGGSSRCVPMYVLPPGSDLDDSS